MAESYFNLDGKHIIITGAAGLLGCEHAKAIAEFKGIPILLDLNHSDLIKLQIEIEENYGIKSIFFVCDITSERDLKSVCEEILKSKIEIYGLINNAARNPKVEDHDFSINRIESLDLKELEKDISVGLIGATLCAKYFGTLISKNKKGGVIINISSDLGLISPDQRIYQDNNSDDIQSVKPVSYSIIKSGIIGLTRYLSTYWCDNNVRCNAICPGGIENNQPTEFKKKLNRLIPLNRMAQKDEYKATIIWMLSSKNEYLNGSIVSVDGGRTVW